MAQGLKPKGYHNFEVGDRTYIVASKANVRDQPSIENGAITTVLYLGARVEIIEKTEASYESNRIKANWYKISFNGREGYIWGGLVAAGWSKVGRSPEMLLLYGLNYCEIHYGDPDVALYYTGNLTLKLCIDNKFVSQTNFDIEDIKAGHQLTFLSKDSILFSANEFSHTVEEAVFKNEYLFSFQDEKLELIDKKYEVAPMPEQNGLIPLEYPEYLRFHGIKRYREIRLWKTQKRPYIPSGDYESRTIKVGKRKGYICENKKFDPQGSLIEDYHYLSEGPLIYKYEYRYLKNAYYPNRIDSIFDKTGLYQMSVRNFIYREDGHRLDSIEFYTIYEGNPKKKVDASTISIEAYEKEESSPEKLIYLGEQLRIKRQSSFCHEYFYENNLLKKDIQFQENCQKVFWEITYKYDAKGLLIGKKVLNPEKNVFTEYLYLYDYYPLSND
jgi:hypothetical protein